MAAKPYTGAWYQARKREDEMLRAERVKQALADIRRILAPFRQQHDYQPGYLWNPYLGKYVPPGDELTGRLTPRRTGSVRL